MECVVIKLQHGYWENRGFARLPFCVIYGFGVMFANIIFLPMRGNLLLIFILGAIGATIFEYIVALGMIKAFGKLWWDYSMKKFNYRGIVCLESTIGWGVIAVVQYSVLHEKVVTVLQMIPSGAVYWFSLILAFSYFIDFTRNVFYSRRSLKKDA